MRLLITGGAGFIGSNLIRHFLEQYEDVEVLNLDLLTYAGNRDNLAGLDGDPRYRFVHGDICDAALVGELVQGVDAVLNLAAESHVDRSIAHDTPFVRTNVNGTHTLLSAALAAPDPPRFVHVSTDEVYGELPWKDPEAPDTDQDRFTEATPLAPRSPYSATKAAGDLLVLAYHRTHGLDALVTRCSNNYGPYQFPEKLIPLMVSNAMKGKSLPVYGDGLNVRDWIHVRDHCRGLDAALRVGRSGEAYNFGGDAERTNLQIVRAILEQTGADPASVTFVEDRLGHDRRYAVDASKAKEELSWAPLVGFEEGLAETIAWYGENREWLGRIESGAYRI
jgi:dTDP-glucose 4,6-dehydratase